jgi:hypothetical protein
MQGQSGAFARPATPVPCLRLSSEGQQECHGDKVECEYTHCQSI